MRGAMVVSTLTGALGQAIREPRITALLGYLMALQPGPFLRLLGFHGTAQQVSLETRHAEGRSDIRVQTNRGVGIVEAKLDASDPHRQSLRYPGRWAALLCHRPSKRAGRAMYVHWNDLAKVLRSLARGQSPRTRLLSADLLEYLEDNNVIKTRDSIEIYAREINEPITLELFLSARVYGCDYKANSRLAEALYFAPHFGQSIEAQHPGITRGISYIAKVESIEYAETWGELTTLLVAKRGKPWWRRHAKVLGELHRDWSWPEPRHYLLLGEPQLAFNPPVKKEKVQRGSGWLSKQFLTFDELFRAWRT